MQNSGTADLPVEPPFFVAGAGRSGTTLMQAILSTHSRLAIPPETHFCRMSEDYAGVTLDRTPPDFEGYWSRLSASRRFQALQIDAAHCRALIEAQGAYGFRQVLGAMLQAYAERTGKQRVGEKTPSHTLFLPLLLDWWPEARAIAMQRDPRAVVASQMRTPFVAEQIALYGKMTAARTRLHLVRREAARWLEFSMKIRHELACDPRVMVVRYEDLVGDPEPVVRRVCAHLGETFEPAMLALGRAADTSAELVPGSPEFEAWQRRHLAKTQGRIGADSVGKWRKELSAAEQAVVEAVTAEGMEACGYKPETAAGLRRRALATAVAASAVQQGEATARRLGRLAQRTLGRAG